MLATRRLGQKLHRLLMEAEGAKTQTTDIEGATRAAAEVARTRAGVLIGSDPGPPPHFPAFIYEPENNSMSPDICDSNAHCSFAVIDKLNSRSRKHRVQARAASVSNAETTTAGATRRTTQRRT